MADNFERAAAAITPETDGEKAVAVYYKDVYDAMITSLEGLGLKEVEMVGADIDRLPNLCGVCSSCVEMSVAHRELP